MNGIFTGYKSQIWKLLSIKVKDSFFGSLEVVEPKVVLQLAVKEPWFSMIVSGEKKEEYREIKDYWTKRFNGGKRYTHVLFVNGYGANRPRIEKEINDIRIGKPKEGWCPNEFLGKEYYVIEVK